MADGYLGKCRECAKKDSKSSNGIYPRECVVCKCNFMTNATEISKGGGKCCGMQCRNIYLKSIVKKDSDSPHWKGDNVKKSALHSWVQKHKGSPSECEHCGTTSAKQYDWANVSGEYRRDLDDFIRLCRSCHAKYDYSSRLPKWRKSVEIRHGWKVGNY